MHDHGIKFVSDLVDSKGNSYSYQSLCNTYNIQISILTYLGLRNSIMHSWPQLNTLNCNIFFPFVPSIVRIYKNNRKGTHIFYYTFISKIRCNHKHIVKWETELLLPNSIFLKRIMPHVFTFTSDTSLRWFQFRISHRILATNRFLFKLNMSPSEMCTFCHNHSETIFHLFIECQYVENLWKKIRTMDI